MPAALPFLIEALEDAPPGICIIALALLAWIAVIGAGSIVWEVLP
jgi:hypothetical protein